MIGEVPLRKGSMMILPDVGAGSKGHGISCFFWSVLKTQCTEITHCNVCASRRWCKYVDCTFIQQLVSLLHAFLLGDSHFSIFWLFNWMGGVVAIGFWHIERRMTYLVGMLKRSWQLDKMEARNLTELMKYCTERQIK